MEGGCDPEPISGPFLDKLSHMVELSEEFVAQCEATLPEDADEETIEAAVESASAIFPDQADAYFGVVERFWQPAMALLSRHRPSHERALSLIHI